MSKEYFLNIYSLQFSQLCELIIFSLIYLHSSWCITFHTQSGFHSPLFSCFLIITLLSIKERFFFCYFLWCAYFGFHATILLHFLTDALKRNTLSLLLFPLLSHNYSHYYCYYIKNSVPRRRKTFFKF